MSSLDPKDAVADYSSLNEGQMNTLNQWESFFEKVRVRGVTVADCGSDTALWAALCSSNSREIHMQCIPHFWPCDLTMEGPPLNTHPTHIYSRRVLWARRMLSLLSRMLCALSLSRGDGLEEIGRWITK